jgi:DNA-directed RNA polymerase subunit N (RpoN/RPB10)
VDGQARNFAKQRWLDSLCLDAECGRKMKATHVDVVADAND